MTKAIWKCTEEKLRKSNLFKFEVFLKKKYGLNHKNNYEKLWKWTIEDSAEFWKSIWEFSNVKGQLGNQLINSSEIFYLFLLLSKNPGVWKKRISFIFLNFNRRMGRTRIPHLFPFWPS